MYDVAHKYFYGLVMNDPTSFLTAVLKNRENFLHNIRTDIENKFEVSIPKKILEEINFSFLTIEDHSIVIIDLPEPEITTEAFAIAVVYTKDNNGENIVRYFLFELGKSADDDKALGFFCELENGNHINFGSVEYIVFGSFIDKILEILNEKIRFLGY